MERGVRDMKTRKAPPNPFATHRWETEQLHQIWIPPTISVVASPKACLISGLRGTGKTALLNCLGRLGPHRDRIEFLNPDALHDHCIGVYINVVKEFTEFLSLMAAEESATSSSYDMHLIQALAFRTYITFTALARALEITDDCRRAEVLTYSADQETVFAKSFINLLANHFESPRPALAATSILECASILNKVCMAIRINSTRLYGERVARLIGYVQPAKFYDDFCKILVSSALLSSGGTEHHIKISLDDVHRFGRPEQTLLNGLLEISTSPITWNLSFITGQFDPSLSSDPAAPLTRHDVERVDLNYESDPKGFRRLCKKLYDMRLGITGGDEREENAGYAKVLGNPNVSVLFGLMVSETASDSFRSRLFGEVGYVAEMLSNLDWPEQRPDSRPKSDPRRYLYQTYVFLVLFRGNRDRFEAFLKSRPAAQVDNYFRQKNVAALIAAANELGRSPPYAGTNALISLSDGNVRDFLLILSTLYDNVASDMSQGQSRIDYFSSQQVRTIPVSEQSRCFIQASRSYLIQIQASTTRVGRVLSALVDGIAQLTRLLQSRDRLKALTEPERGQISLNLTEVTLVGDALSRIDLLRRAIVLGQYVGVVRILKGSALPETSSQSSGQILFRLHRLVAPEYNYSSRGPFRAVHLQLRTALELTEERFIDAQSWAERVYGEVVDVQDVFKNGPEQHELFK